MYDDGKLITPDIEEGYGQTPQLFSPVLLLRSLCSDLSPWGPRGTLELLSTVALNQFYLLANKVICCYSGSHTAVLWKPARFLVASELQTDSTRVSSRAKGQGRMESVCREVGER